MELKNNQTSIKSVFAITLLLVLLDAVASIFLGIFSGDASIYLGSSMVRICVIGVLLPTIGIMVQSTIGKGFYFAIIFSIIATYLLLPTALYFMKGGPEDILDVYISLHSRRDLFTTVLLPYILASLASVGLMHWLKLTR